MDQRWLDFLGRLHPFLLHIPIGMLVTFLLLEGLGKLSSASAVHGGQRRLITSLLCLSALATAGSGWLLGEEQGYSAGVFLWHRGFGIAFGASTVVLALSALFGWRGLYRFGLLVACFTIVPAGHFGASMTHGANFLTEPLGEREGDAPDSVQPSADVQVPEGLEESVDEGQRPSASSEGAALVATVAVEESLPEETWFDVRIAPMLETYCVSCHGAEKQKGDLALHTGELVLAGNEFGLVVIPGDPAESALLQRMVVPLDDDDHMPPSSKPQPSALELAELRRWIAAGASLEAPAPPALSPDELPQPEAQTPKETAGLAPTVSVEQAPAVSLPLDAIESLRAERVHIEVLDPAAGLLWVDFRSRADSDDEFVGGALGVLGDTIAELSLAGTAISDAVLARLAEHQRLEELDLSRTAVTGSALAALEGCSSLRELNLTGAGVGEDAAASLATLPALERALIWRSGLSSEAIEQLRASRPELELVTGELRVLEAAEVEPPVSFSKHPELDPVNTACPLTGSPVDPRYRVVHEDRVVGFCCPNCPTTFLKSPEKYPLSE